MCDLFAGSGVVSEALARNWSVTAVDIQEYSRILCEALLRTPPGSTEARWAEVAAKTTLRRDLRRALRAILAAESKAILEAKSGRVEALANLAGWQPLLSLDSEGGPEADYIPEAQAEAIRELKRFQLDSGPDTVITRYYGGVYFSWSQAIDLDAILAAIHELDDGTKPFLLAAAFGAATDAVNSVGKHFAQPLQLRKSDGVVKGHLVGQTVKNRSVDIPFAFEHWRREILGRRRAEGSHQVVRADYRAALANPSIKFDAAYADPPYTRDHYSRFYHILETMACHDEPSVSDTAIRAGGRRRPSRGLYRSERHQSPFCIQSQAEGAFDRLASGVAARNVPLVLSYSPFGTEHSNRPRLVTVRRVDEVLRSHFSTVSWEPLDGLAHSKLNRRERNVPVDYPAEVLFTCLP